MRVRFLIVLRSFLAFLQSFKCYNYYKFLLDGRASLSPTIKKYTSISSLVHPTRIWSRYGPTRNISLPHPHSTSQTTLPDGIFADVSVIVRVYSVAMRDNCRFGEFALKFRFQANFRLPQFIIVRKWRMSVNISQRPMWWSFPHKCLCDVSRLPNKRKEFFVKYSLCDSYP